MYMRAVVMTLASSAHARQARTLAHPLGHTGMHMHARMHMRARTRTHTQNARTHARNARTHARMHARTQGGTDQSSAIFCLTALVRLAARLSISSDIAKLCSSAGRPIGGADGSLDIAAADAVAVEVCMPRLDVHMSVCTTAHMSLNMCVHISVETSIDCHCSRTRCAAAVVVYTYIYTSFRTLAHVHTHLETCLWRYIHVCTACLYRCPCICLYRRRCPRGPHASVCAPRACTCMCARICMCTHTHTPLLLSSTAARLLSKTCPLPSLPAV